MKCSEEEEHYISISSTTEPFPKIQFQSSSLPRLLLLSVELKTLPFSKGIRGVAKGD